MQLTNLVWKAWVWGCKQNHPSWKQIQSASITRWIICSMQTQTLSCALIRLWQSARCQQQAGNHKVPQIRIPSKTHYLSVSTYNKRMITTYNNATVWDVSHAPEQLWNMLSLVIWCWYIYWSVWIHTPPHTAACKLFRGWITYNFKAFISSHIQWVENQSKLVNPLI